MTELYLPASAKELVPHRGTMLLIDELSEYTPEHVSGRTCITNKNPFLDAGGKLDGICFVEILAQLAAAGEGYEARKGGGRVKSGYLVGVNDFSIHRQARLGDILHARMNKTLKVNNINVLEGNIFLGEECISSGKLKLYVAENEPEAPSMTPSTDFSDDDNDKVFTPYHRSVIYTQILNNLKAIDVSMETGRASGEFCFDKEFLGFHGHFPGYPILPGIIMIGMSVAVCEAACMAPMMLASLERAKFSKQVIPGDTVRVEVNIQEIDDRYKVRSHLTTAGSPTATLDFTAEKDDLNK